MICLVATLGVSEVYQALTELLKRLRELLKTEGLVEVGANKLHRLIQDSIDGLEMSITILRLDH